MADNTNQTIWQLENDAELNIVIADYIRAYGIKQFEAMLEEALDATLLPTEFDKDLREFRAKIKQLDGYTKIDNGEYLVRNLIEYFTEKGILPHQFLLEVMEVLDGFSDIEMQSAISEYDGNRSKNLYCDAMDLIRRASDKCKEAETASDTLSFNGALEIIRENPALRNGSDTLTAKLVNFSRDYADHLNETGRQAFIDTVKCLMRKADHNAGVIDAEFSE